MMTKSDGDEMEEVNDDEQTRLTTLRTKVGRRGEVGRN
jgi:hypothetical protein